MFADNLTQRQLWRYTILLQLFWMAVIGVSFFWNLQSENEEIIKLASVEAQISLDKDLLYRRWGTRHGGVYVPVSPETPPNPYLADIPERDITTPSGRQLTLLNPAYMARQLNEMAKGENEAHGHLTSLNPINPDNAPDAWERQALQAFARGESEVISTKATINGVPYLRVMHRLVVEKGCLPCHLSQGYREGDVRGGLSAAVPLVPYYAVSMGHSRTNSVAHGLIWLVGAAVFAFGFVRFRRGIATQQRVKQALEQAALEWAAAMDVSDDPIYLLDLGRRILRANQAFGQLAGQAPESLVGQHIEAVIHPEGEKAPCPVCQAQNELRDAVLTMEADHPDNPARRPIEITVKIVRDQGDQPVSILMTLHSLEHARNEMEEKAVLESKLRQAQKMEAIGTLAGGIAHDFNNILSPIFGYTEMALMNLPVDSPVADDLRQVLTASRRAKELVQQILSFSRQRERELKPIRLQLVITESLKLLRASIPTTISIHEEIDPGCEAVLADPTQIQQVIMNLCTNAYHAMREKGGILTIGLGTVELSTADMASTPVSEAGRYVQFTVADTGSGMSREMLERIFEPYFTTKKKGEGTGLGLSVVHGIVQGLGGAVTVYSEPDHGTEFHVYLPAIAVSTEEAVAPALLPLATGNERVLVVDDDASTLDVMQHLLAGLGYQVVPFDDSVAALAAFCERPQDFDLVITDMTMPTKTGEEVAREVLALRPGMPVILCTGFSENMSPEKAKAMGVRRFLMKPLILGELACTVRAVLDGEDAGGSGLVGSA